VTEQGGALHRWRRMKLTLLCLLMGTIMVLAENGNWRGFLHAVRRH
jgi:hypothetical protein